MKLTVMYNTTPIYCESIAQAAALAKEIDILTRGSRSNGARAHADEGSVLFNILIKLGRGGRRFVAAITSNSEWQSTDQLASDLGFKKTTDLEGAISSMKTFLKRGGVEFAEVFEEKSGSDGRFLRIRPALFDLVKKAVA